MEYPPELLAPLPSYETRFKAGDKAALLMLLLTARRGNYQCPSGCGLQ